MDPHSSTTSFKLPDWTKKTLFLFVMVFALDSFCYKAGFPLFDKMNHFGKMNQRADILILGSSNILWAIDSEELSGGLQKKVDMFSLAGGTMEFRYYFLKDYLDKHKENPPKLILFHTDRFAFNKKRYGDESYKSLQGYYHSGLFREYLNYKWQGSFDSYMKKLFKSYSLNSEAYFIYSKMFDKLPITLALVSPLYSQETNQSGTPQEESKIEDWKKLYGDPKEFLDFDEGFVKHFELSVELMKKYPEVQFLLLETPMIEFFDESLFDPTRNYFRGAEASHIKYVYINDERFKTDERLYYDASHFNLIGRNFYTSELKKYLEKFLQ